MEKTGWFACAASVMKLPSGLDRYGAGILFVVAEERIEAARAVERGEVVVSADVALADVDLRDGAPSRALHHLLAALGLEVDAHLLDFDALRLEQPLGHEAERAHAGRVHQHLRHRYRSTGRLACCHAATPPLRKKTLANPERRRNRQAVPARVAPLSVTITALSLNFASSPRRPGRSRSGMLRARGRWPDANSLASRMSSTSEPDWFMSRVASSVPTSAPPPPASFMISGHRSITPLARKSATSARLFMTNSPMGEETFFPGKEPEDAKGGILPHHPLQQPQRHHPGGDGHERVAPPRARHDGHQAGDPARVVRRQVDGALLDEQARNHDRREHRGRHEGEGLAEAPGEAVRIGEDDERGAQQEGR